MNLSAYVKNETCCPATFVPSAKPCNASSNAGDPSAPSWGKKSAWVSNPVKLVSFETTVTLNVLVASPAPAAEGRMMLTVGGDEGPFFPGVTASRAELSAGTVR